jgi:predicted DCC family thiol-disulfide oxidoreductase YuxK
MADIPEGKKLVLFDGVCNLCNSSVQFILKRDRQQSFVFASLQGETGQFYLNKFGLPQNTLNSFLLVDDGKLYNASSGALRVLKWLGHGWQLFYAFMIVPKFIRDAVYNVIARNRYKWFGKKDACWLPAPQWENRFLD